MKNEVFEINRSRVRTQNTLSFSVVANAKQAESFVKALKAGITVLNETKRILEGIELNQSAKRNFHEFKLLLNRYTLFRSDCQWEDYDAEVKSAMKAVDVCYRLLLAKNAYKLADVIYVNNVLTEAAELFDRKIDEVNDFIQV